VEYIFSTSTTKVSSISLAKEKKTSSHDWLNLIVCTKPTRTTDVMSSDKRHPRDVPYIRIELATTNEYHLPKATYETTCYHEVRHTVNSFFVALFFIRVLRQTNRQLRVQGLRVQLRVFSSTQRQSDPTPYLGGFHPKRHERDLQEPTEIIVSSSFSPAPMHVLSLRDPSDDREYRLFQRLQSSSSPLKR
jgi:hypothetical protein